MAASAFPEHTVDMETSGDRVSGLHRGLERHRNRPDRPRIRRVPRRRGRPARLPLALGVRRGAPPVERAPSLPAAARLGEGDGGCGISRRRTIRRRGSARRSTSRSFASSRPRRRGRDTVRRAGGRRSIRRGSGCWRRSTSRLSDPHALASGRGNRAASGDGGPVAGAVRHALHGPTLRGVGQRALHAVPRDRLGDRQVALPPSGASGPTFAANSAP